MHVCARARGTSPIACIELYRGREVIARWWAPAFDEVSTSRRLRIAWGGARIRVDGAEIERFSTFAFDSPMDGLKSSTEHELTLRSRTTVDIDSVDLWLDRATAGRLSFATITGAFDVDLAQLGVEGRHFEFGGLDLHATIMRHPEALHERALEFDTLIDLPTDEPSALMIKVTQEDGHMAWARQVLQPPA